MFNPIEIDEDSRRKLKEAKIMKTKKLIKDMTDLELEDICMKQNNCRQCPLMMNVFIEDDDTYDYHQNVVCYKKYARKIKKIEETTLEV